MPEGFEQLGAEGLRDLLAYLCADETRFRMLDLTSAFTANNSRGLYNSPDNTDETVSFRSYGMKRVDDIPFDVISPQKAIANVVVLKGGSPNSWSRKSLPQKVEVKVGVPANRLHFLGGVAGWGFPAVRDDQLPVLKTTVYFADGSTEELIQRNGQEIADYIGQIDVPKSKGLPQFTRRGQIRWLTQDIKGTGVIEKLTLESYDNHVAPTLFAITADNGPRGAGQSAVSNPTPTATVASVATQLESAPKTALRILIVGGGTHHDFQRWFNLADVETLRELPGAVVAYTENTDDIAAAAANADVIYLSNNKPIGSAASRKAIFDHVQAGKGLLLIHPALWYNWADWPEYNRQLVGGGSKSHDKYGEFEVTVLGNVKSPVSAGLPASFKITDELYHHIRDDQGVPPLVLATGKSPVDGREFPVLWLSQNRDGRIVCLTLGHDGQAHSHPAFKQLLKQAANWAAGREPLKTTANRQ
jgi:type 1 glutamine amidotransferase